MRPQIAGELRTIDRLMTITSSAFAAGVLLSHRLWYAPDRLYPLAPVISSMRVPDWIDLALLIALLVALMFVALRQQTVLMARVAVVITALFVLLDQSRLQPWVYEYCLLLLVLSFSDRAGALMTCRLIVIALYFWSAMQKMNVTFITHTWPDMSAAFPAAAHVGWIAPMLELAIAIGLLVARFRRIAVILAIAMHASILVLLLLARENSVVWPWNIAMAALTFLLFRRTNASAAAITWGHRSSSHAVLAVVAGLLPVMTFVELWDSYLSAALYSGNTIQSIVLVRPDSISRLPALIRENTWQQSQPMFIDINRWSYDELNVPAYPARRVMKSVGATLCRTWTPTGVFRILGRPRWSDGVRDSESWACRANRAAR